MNPNQEAYEKIRADFSRPGAKFGWTEEYGCVYRKGQVANSPVRCSIGDLIRDEDYEPSWDGPMGGELIKIQKHFPVSFSKLLGKYDYKFLYSVQCAHDTAALMKNSLASFIARLDEVAALYGLKVVTS